MNNRSISLNIKYLCSENNLTQTEFGELFGLGRSVVNMYISAKSTPQLKTIIEICKYFKILIDDFVLNDLSKINYKVENRLNSNDNEVDCKMCEMYERMLEDKEKLIKALEREIASLRNEDYDAGQAANQTA